MNNVVHKSSGLKKERKRGRTDKLVMILAPLAVLLYFSCSNTTDFLFSA